MEIYAGVMLHIFLHDRVYCELTLRGHSAEELGALANLSSLRFWVEHLVERVKRLFEMLMINLRKHGLLKSVHHTDVRCVKAGGCVLSTKVQEISV